MKIIPFAWHKISHEEKVKTTEDRRSLSWGGRPFEAIRGLHPASGDEVYDTILHTGSFIGVVKCSTVRFETHFPLNLLLSLRE